MAIPITPDSTVYLLKCPLESDNLHQLTFANATAQFNYFNSLPKLEFDNVSYQRKDGVIRINAHIDDIINYNYVMYQNSNYSDKWYYAFITHMEYANDNVTFVTIKTDVWQTWQHNLTFRKCFVEREHVNDDTIGLHTVPEGLETGDYICNDNDELVIGKVSSASQNPDPIVVLFQVTTVNLYNGNSIPTSTYNIYGGIPQGLYVFGIELNADNATIPDLIIQEYDKSNQKDAIISLSLVPKRGTAWTSQAGTGETFGNFNFLIPDSSWDSTASLDKSFTVDRANAFQGYIPKNNKLYISPYCYFHISNFAGADISYAYENFNGNPHFEISSTLGVGGSVKLEPTNSKVSDNSGNYKSFDEGISAMVLPTLSWTSNYYLNWVAQNKKNFVASVGLSVAGGLISDWMSIGGGASADMWYNPEEKRSADNHPGNYGSSGSGIGSVLGTVMNAMQTIKEVEMTPPEAKGNSTAVDLAYSQKGCSFICYKMSVRREFAEQIDNFFSLYGYRVNMTKVPNIYGRENWNYIKLIDANILGDIPTADMNEIKNLFHRGITLWHNPNTFLDYTQNNNIV